MEIESVLDPKPEKLGFEHQIWLKSISFQYRAGRQPVVEDIDVKIAKQSSVAFVGSTGSGKTTLVDIVVGLLAPQDGSLQVDDTTIDSANLASWLELVAYVPQEVFLYDATVTENIAFGLEPDQIDLARVQAAARIAQLDDFVSRDLTSGYETRIGERGVRLSGGQRQRLGLARAFYRQPKILILDEATSALDGITEEAVLDELHTKLPDLTIIMIAHRLSTVKLCERIYMIDGGRIADVGTYGELLASNRMFQRMVEKTT